MALSLRASAQTWPGCPRRLPVRRRECALSPDLRTGKEAQKSDDRDHRKVHIRLLAPRRR